MARDFDRQTTEIHIRAALLNRFTKARDPRDAARRIMPTGVRGASLSAQVAQQTLHTLKVELVHQHRWATRDEARRDFSSIEGCCNRARIHSAIGCLTPEQVKRKASQPRVHQDRGRSTVILPRFGGRL